MNRGVFRARRNECRVDAAVTVDGRLFHALVVATRNARSPSDDLLVAGTTSAGDRVEFGGARGRVAMLTLERKVT